MAPWESTLSTSIHEHPARCTGRDRSWYHGRAPHPRAHTSILCSAHGSMGQHPIHEHPRASCALHRQRSIMGPWESIPSTSSHERPARCTGRNRSWVHGGAHHPRGSTSILCTAHGSMGEHPIHEHTRASCALHRQEPLMGPWGGTPSKSIHEHPGRCNRRKRSWAHARAPHPRKSTSSLCAAQAGIAQGLMGEHPMQEQPRASCALRRQGSLMGPC